MYDLIGIIMVTIAGIIMLNYLIKGPKRPEQLALPPGRPIHGRLIQLWMGMRLHQ